MPRRRTNPRRRFDASKDSERDTIIAGLLGEECPPGGNRFAHLEALCPRRRSVSWPQIQAVFRSLSARERREIIAVRRERRLGEEAYDAA